MIEQYVYIKYHNYTLHILTTLLWSCGVDASVFISHLEVQVKIKK